VCVCVCVHMLVFSTSIHVLMDRSGKNWGNEKTWVGTTESGKTGVAVICWQLDVEITSTEKALAHTCRIFSSRENHLKHPPWLCANLPPFTPAVIRVSCQGPQLEPRRMPKEGRLEIRMDRLCSFKLIILYQKMKAIRIPGLSFFLSQIH